MSNNKNYGVINEQGFVTEKSNMGFKPISEQEKAEIDRYLNEKYKNINNNKNN